MVVEAEEIIAQCDLLALLQCNPHVIIVEQKAILQEIAQKFKCSDDGITCGHSRK